jgi:RimJ/RimL family protein N-acetyltransferase
MQSHRPLAQVLFDGLQDGKVYADDTERATTALICPANGFCFACGEPRAGLVRALLPELRAELPEKPELYATSAAWRTALAPLFAGSLHRLGFERDGPDGVPPALAPGLSLTAIEPWMAQRWNPADDQTGLDPWIFDIWGGPDGFAARSFGMAVLSEGQPVAFTAACAIGGDEAEVEVGTASAWRQRGLATAACRAFMAECRQRSLSPTWTCQAENTASIALAKRLGYRVTEDVWGFPLEAE